MAIMLCHTNKQTPKYVNTLMDKRDQNLCLSCAVLLWSHFLSVQVLQKALLCLRGRIRLGDIIL